MKRFLYFVWKHVYLRRRFLLTTLALLSILLLLAYNNGYNRIENNERRRVEMRNGESRIRRITTSNPSVTKIMSENNTSVMKVPPNVATTKITTTRVNYSTKAKADNNNHRSPEGKYRRLNVSSTIKNYRGIETIRRLKTETKTTVKLTTPINIKAETETNTKSNLPKSNKANTGSDTKQTLHKPKTIIKTKAESKITTFTPTILNKTTTDPQVSTVNIANDTTTAKIQATVTNKTFLGGTRYPDVNIKKMQHKNKMTYFSFRNPLRSIVKENFFEPYCAMYSNSFKYLIWPDSPSDLNDWSYKSKRKCPEFTVPENISNTKRVKYTLKCDKNHPKLIPSFTNRSDDIQLITMDDPCLAEFTNSCCNDTRGIPNIVHYVWYFKNEMSFSMFISMLSVIRFVRPCLILFHGEYLPLGKYWDYIVRIYPNILHVLTIRPLYIFGKKIYHHEHSGDIMRMKALMQLGGVYFDTDVIVLRDLEPLREYDMTLCYQTTGFLLNAFIMAKKNATFLNLWMDGYRKDYQNDSYVYNSMFYNKDLANNRTDLIHIEEGTICSPLVLIGEPVNSTMVYNWSKLFGYHLYSRTIHFPLSEGWIKHFNSTVGAMVRHVIYGNKELCEGPVHTFS